MRRLAHAVALALLPLAAHAAPAGSAAETWTAKLVPQITTWRRDIHQHPELGSHETRTAKLVADQLRKLGYQVKTGIAVTGVVGILKGGKPGPKIAIRADMDALPVVEETGLPFASTAKSTYNGQPVGVMHACGHDAHTAMTLGVATALAGMRKDLAGEVMFIFQPAEEGPPPGEEGGASRMMDEGLFKDFTPEAVFGMHVFYTLHAGMIGVREGSLLASSDRFTIDVVGKQTHGAQPWRGIDPIVTASEIVVAAQPIVSRQLDISKYPAVLSFGRINGGVRYNIIPDKVTLEGTIRTLDEGMRRDVFERLTRTAEHVAAANGTTIEAHIPVDKGNPATVNDPALTRRMRKSLERSVGADKVVDVPPSMVAEDFSYYARAVPGMYFFVGSVAPEQDLATAAPNHSPKFLLDESALAVGTRAMLQVALDYLGGPSE